MRSPVYKARRCFLDVSVQVEVYAYDQFGCHLAVFVIDVYSDGGLAFLECPQNFCGTLGGCDKLAGLGLAVLETDQFKLGIGDQLADLEDCSVMLVLIQTCCGEV